MNSTRDQVRAGDQINALIDQLSLLIDELEAQMLMFGRLPEQILTGRAWADAPSIQDLYIRFRDRERGLNHVVIRGLVDGSAEGHDIEALPCPDRDGAPDDEEMSTIVNDISTGRTRNVELLQTADGETWKRIALREGQPVTLFEFAYEMALRDADDLREIATQFYERKLTFKSGS